MNKIEDGGPAFPVEVDRLQPHGRETGITRCQTYGMSLRDYFAAKALQGLLDDAIVHASSEHFAASAYKLADAMIRARSNHE